MGIILDSSILIAGERQRQTVAQILSMVRAWQGDIEAALSVVTVIELTHGIYRARSDSDRNRRRAFCEELCRDMVVHPVTVDVAEIAGRIEGEQAAIGISIAFEDLLIGATALHLGYAVATLNIQHFQVIPGLQVLRP